MKNRKGNGIGASEPSLNRRSTVNSGQRREIEERGGHRTQREIDARSLWKQVEDVVVAQLGLGVIDHVIYVHLLRHSQLEGKRRLHFSIPWLAHNINLSTCPTREAVRRLAAYGVLRLVERSKQGHVAEVRLPEEVRGRALCEHGHARRRGRVTPQTSRRWIS